MQQSEILSDNIISNSNNKESLESLIEKLSSLEDQSKKPEIYRKIEIEIIKCDNLNSIQIHQAMSDYFAKITDPNEFDKKLIKLMLSSGWILPKDFIELDSLNIKESQNDFYADNIEIKIQDYKKIYENLPIQIEERFRQEFFKSLETAFKYFIFCKDPLYEVEYNKKNILRIDVNGVKVGFSPIGLYEFLGKIEFKKGNEKLSFDKFVEDFEDSKFLLYFQSLKEKCVYDKQISTDLEFAKQVIDSKLICRTSLESSKRLSSQNSRFSLESLRRVSSQNFPPVERKILKFEGNKFVIKDPEPTCFSFLKTVFCNCFPKKNQTPNMENQSSENPKPSSDHSLHPSTSFIVTESRRQDSRSPSFDSHDIIMD